jgi:hypothetical protein
MLNCRIYTGILVKGLMKKSCTAEEPGMGGKSYLVYVFSFFGIMDLHFPKKMSGE